MFNWFKSKNDKKVESTPVSDDLTRLDDTKNKQRLINQIQTLSGVTQDDFKSLYVVTIERFSDYLIEPNQAISLSLLLTVLKEVVLALKKRQGYLLPLGADSETSFREREEWTYAIFSGALLKEIDQQSRYDVAKAIIPKQAFAWLHRNTQLFGLWQSTLQGQSTILSDIIIVQSVKPMAQPETKETMIKETGAIEREETQTTKQYEKPELPQGAMIQEINLTDLGDSDKKAQAPPWKDETETEKVEQPIEALVELPKFTAQAFWQWLPQALQEELITVNQPDSVVHRIDRGLLLVLPKIVDAFIHEQIKQLGLHGQSTAGLDQLISLTKAIKKHEALIRNSKGSRIHSYCFGKWEDRQVISGLLIKPEDLLSDGHVDLAINESLSIDPIDNTE